MVNQQQDPKNKMTNPVPHHTESEIECGLSGTANTSGRKTNRKTLSIFSHAALTEPANRPTYSREDFDQDIQEGHLYQDILANTHISSE